MSTFISYSYIPKIKSPRKTAHMYIVNLFSSTTVELPSVTKLFADKFWKLMVKKFHYNYFRVIFPEEEWS